MKSNELTICHLFSSCLHVSHGIKNPLTDCGANKRNAFVVLDTFINKINLHSIGLQNFNIYVITCTVLSSSFGITVIVLRK